MAGGAGNDTYMVDNVGDGVTELSGQGADTVRTGISHSLSNYVETLILIGTGNINGTGNALANTLLGNTGSNILDGKLGADTMKGGAGNDTYRVDNVGDVITELAGLGTDTVQTAMTYTLGNNVENLTLTGVGRLNGTGNALVNTLLGNSGNNILDGKIGADTMTGGTGNDRYFVDNALDKAIEATGSGADQVLASTSYALTANSAIETLSTTNAAGTMAINLTGNSLAQANLINGMAGSDTLWGLGGNDTFRFSTTLGAGNIDRILDYNVAADTIQLENAVFTGLLRAGAFFKGSVAHDTDDRIIYNAANGALIFDSNGNAAGGAVQFATVATGLAMTNADFVVT
jgi:Ca2+-binding RTX toxin-like protein